MIQIISLFLKERWIFKNSQNLLNVVLETTYPIFRSFLAIFNSEWNALKIPTALQILL